MRKEWFCRGCFCLLSIAVLLGAVGWGWARGTQQNLAENVLRLHIVAASDRPEDQAVKLKVRDRVLRDCGWLFSGCATAREAAERAREGAGLLRRAAGRELLRQGVLAPVTLSVEPCDFPTKQYGRVRLPAGTYTAVNIRIGPALGANWWCVLYPPLCLTQGVVAADQAALDRLRENLPPQDYALVTQADSIEIVFRFKILEALGH